MHAFYHTYAEPREIEVGPGRSMLISAWAIGDDAVWVKPVDREREALAEDGSPWLDAQGWGWLCEEEDVAAYGL